MRRTIAAAAIALALAVPLSANDSRTVTRFLFDYVGALRLVQAGDARLAAGDCGAAREQYTRARNVMAPYEQSREADMRGTTQVFTAAISAREACRSAVVNTTGVSGPLAQSAIQLSWVLYWPSEIDQLWVRSHDRQQAVRDLQDAFGPVISGPKSGQNDLEIAAATLAYFLAHPPQSPYAYSAWEHYVQPPRP
ncbi:MAG TPA: hypothetical protein VEZ11_10660 [Thermoanaerobaculia bacterium]|nr:hypothetical protein [Thermoanaerobaculia bacterium]